jgi:2-hydroxy-3-oxopropionate reductase
MSRHLLKAGHPLFILSSSKAHEELKGEGATVVDSIAKLASLADVVITMLPDSPEVESVVFGKEGVLANAKSGRFSLICQQLHLPRASRSLRRWLHREFMPGRYQYPVDKREPRQPRCRSWLAVYRQCISASAPHLLEHRGKNIVHIGGAGSGRSPRRAINL